MLYNNGETAAVIESILQAADQGAITVAAEPKVISDINDVLSQDNISIFDVARVIRTEPVLAAKVMQVANSALLCLQPCASLNDGISRLGISMVRNLAVCIMLKNSFNTQHHRLKIGMNGVTKSTSTITAVSGAISTDHPILKTDVALLVGLMSNIGKMVAFTYIDTHYTAEQIDRMSIDDILDAVNARVGKCLLSRWGVPYTIIDTAFSDNCCASLQMIRDYKDLVSIARSYDRGYTDQQTTTEIDALLHRHRYSIEEFLKMM